MEAAHIQPSFSGSEERRTSALLQPAAQQIHQVCSVSFVNAQQPCQGFSSYSLFAQTQPASTFPHSDLFIMICSVCLASLRLDSARVEPESPQHPRNRHASLRSLSLACFMLIKVSAEGDA